MGKKINDPLGILTRQSSDTLVEENGQEKDPLGILKKKEATVEGEESKEPSTGVGSSVSGEPAKQPTGPSISPIAGSPGDPLGIGEVIAKTVYSGFAHQLPGAIASMPALNNQSYEDYLFSKEPSTKKNVIAGGLFTTNLKNLELGKAFSIGQKEIKEEFLRQKREEMGGKFEEEKKKYEEGRTAKNLEARKQYETFAQKRQEMLGGVPQSYKDIRNPQEAVQYLSYQFGQAVPTMAAAGLAPGVGSYILEATDSYNENVDETAKALDKTPHEVIKEGLDKPAKEIASNVGMINAALDLGGIGSIAAGLRKVLTKEAGKQIAKKSLSAKLVNVLKEPLLIEPVTETVQEANTAYSSQIAAGKTDKEAWEYTKENYPRLVDSFIGGLTGAGGAKIMTGKTVRQTIKEAKSNIRSADDLGNITKAAEEITNKVKTAPEEGVQNAVQKSETGEVLQRPSEGVGETGGGRGGVEPSEQGKETPIAGEERHEGGAPLEQEETIKPKEDVNEIGLRGTVSETGIPTEQERGEQPSSSGGINRPQEVRGEENVGDGGEGPQAPQQVEKVFVYGTLKDVKTRKEALGENVQAEEATAKGTVTENKKYPDFHPEGKHEIKGEVLTLTPEQIKKLDNWEEKYDRKQITLDNGEKAWVYEEKPEYEQTARKAGFKNASHLLASVKKRTGQEYEKVQDVPPEVLAKVTEERKGTKEVFSKITDLYDRIQSTEGSSKRRRLAEERRTLLEQHPSVKYIDDNISSIYGQLEQRKLITKKGKCP